METQDKILKTSLELFFKYGIKRVTMDDIARELGMSKKTIYQFYKEKDDLVSQLCKVELAKQQIEFSSLQDQATDPLHEIILISQKMRNMLQPITPVFFLDLQKFYPKAYDQFRSFREYCTSTLIVKNIKVGVEMGLYRKDINVAFTAEYRMAQIDMLMFGNYFSYDAISFIQAHELVLDMFVYSICSLKGHRLLNNYKKIKDEE
jgi:AcrR family transcriptional regulator